MKKTTPHSEQSKAFIDAARELGCDENPARFEEKLKKVAAHKPKPEPSKQKSVAPEKESGK
jgi:hypothetical protein